MAEFKYAGNELGVFAHAVNWKAYWARALRPFMAGAVLEVGAGIGVNSALLVPLHSGSWTCLEPDRALLEDARSRLERAGLAPELVCGTLASLDPARTFDTIVYLDVLEHIEHDRAEMELAAARLSPGGRIVVLAPAHQQLFTEFDRAVGHFRRYDKRSLAAVGPRGLVRERLFYLDSVGLCASLANRLFLRQGQPTIAQIRLWDRAMIPLSRVLDPLLLRRAGKTVVGVWRKPR